MTFFGGETLLNFPTLRTSVDYAKRKCAEAGKHVEFSLTTNATMLTEQIVDFLAEHKIGVTVSIDGDRELNDKMRVFSDGRGSYDVIVPRIKMLLHRHKTLWDDPDVFDPDRFAPEHKAERHRFQYIPFGAGPRTCVGARFATAEAMTILAHWLAGWRFRPVPGHVVATSGMVTLRPAGGLPLRAEPRGA